MALKNSILFKVCGLGFLPFLLLHNIKVIPYPDHLWVLAKGGKVRNPHWFVRWCPILFSCNVILVIHRVLNDIWKGHSVICLGVARRWWYAMWPCTHRSLDSTVSEEYIRTWIWQRCLLTTRPSAPDADMDELKHQACIENARSSADWKHWSMFDFRGTLIHTWRLAKDMWYGQHSVYAWYHSCESGGGQQGSPKICFEE